MTFLESRTRTAAVARIAISMIFVVVLWEILTATLVKNRLVLVPPIEVAKAIVHEARSGALWTNALATLFALAISFPVAVAAGVAFGLALSSSRLLSLMTGPMLTGLNSIPIIALAPLFIAWLGLGFASKFAIVSLIAIFPVIVTTEVGLNGADSALIDAARSFDASPWQIFKTVTLPFALPFIIGGVRVAWARAVTGVIVAEFFGSFAGFGFAILAASQTFDTATLLAYVIILGVLGLLGSIFFEWLERRLAPWRRE